VPGGRANHQSIGAERFLVEEDFVLEPEGGVKLSVVVPGIGSHIDPQIANHSLGDRTINRWTLDGIRSPVTEHEGLIDLKFVSLGVAAEIVVVLKDEHPRSFTRSGMEEPCRRKAADAAAHHDQVVTLTGALGLPGMGPECTIAQLVCDLKRARMAAAQSMSGRWIVSGTILRSRHCLGEEPRVRSDGRGDGHGRSIHKVAARD